jgi:dyslexia susceptibility 1 candidate gene 1 protein
MERGSHLGAVSAFSLAIRLSPNMAAPHVQRAQAHFVLRNLMKVVEDASRALELLTPKVTANLEERFQCHLVRGRAFDRLGMEKEASLDLKEAVLLRPEDLGVYDEYVEIQTKLDHLSEDGGAGDDRHDL